MAVLCGVGDVLQHVVKFFSLWISCSENNTK